MWFLFCVRAEIPIFSGVRVTRSLVLYVRFVALCLSFWPLCCLFFFDLRILITPMASSNSSYHIVLNMYKCIFLQGKKNKFDWINVLHKRSFISDVHTLHIHIDQKYCSTCDKNLLYDICVINQVCGLWELLHQVNVSCRGGYSLLSDQREKYKLYAGPSSFSYIF